jgi:hypothetical protein
MKQKLTLTVDAEIIKRAKKMARYKGVSVSQMFEEAFSDYDVQPIETESQKAANRFLSVIDEADSSKPLNDRELRQQHLIRKYG